MTKFQFSSEVEARDLTEAWSIIRSLPANLSPAEVHLWAPFLSFEIYDDANDRAVTINLTGYDK